MQRFVRECALRECPFNIVQSEHLPLRTDSISTTCSRTILAPTNGDGADCSISERIAIAASAVSILMRISFMNDCYIKVFCFLIVYRSPLTSS
jgi:hypothetical protein